MTVRRCVAWMVVAVAISGSPVARAQGIGLPVADTTEVRTAGDTEFSAGFAYGENMISCGARAMASFADEVRAFFDLGWSEPEGANDGNIAMQLGGIYALPIEFPSDLGLRAAGYYVDTDSVDIRGCSLMLLSSGESIVDGLHLYGGIGADLSDREVEITRSMNSSRGELNPALSLGAIYFFTTQLSVYIEASHVDAPLIGCGVRYR